MAACLDDVCGSYKVESEDKVKEFFEAVGGQYVGCDAQYKLKAKGDGTYTESLVTETGVNVRNFTPSVEFQFGDYKATIKFDCGTLTEERCNGKKITITRKFEGDKVCSEFCAEGVAVCGKNTMKKC